jgi:hypothetical protein
VARNWFGLVGSVENREELERIKMQISSLDQVRPLRPLQGDTLPDSSGAGLTVKRVNALAKGHLIVRRLGVDAEFPVTLDFFYRTTEGYRPHPERVLVSLKKPLRVVLREHEIAPRDDSGALDLKGNELLGSLVGNVALVEGSLEFFPKTPPSPPEPDSR